MISSAWEARSRAASEKQSEANTQRRPRQRSAPTAISAQTRIGRLDLESAVEQAVGIQDRCTHFQE